LTTSTRSEIGRARMTYLQGEYSYKSTEEEDEDEEEEEEVVEEEEEEAE